LWEAFDRDKELLDITKIKRINFKKKNMSGIELMEKHPVQLN
jgi:hypothetical protein